IVTPLDPPPVEPPATFTVIFDCAMTFESQRIACTAIESDPGGALTEAVMLQFPELLTTAPPTRTCRWLNPELHVLPSTDACTVKGLVTFAPLAGAAIVTVLPRRSAVTSASLSSGADASWHALAPRMRAIRAKERAKLGNLVARCSCMFIVPPSSPRCTRR